MKLLALGFLLAVMMIANDVTANCEYECDWHPQGPCRLKITSMINLAAGPHGAIYVPKCKPCEEVCRPVNGFSGGMAWNV